MKTIASKINDIMVKISKNCATVASNSASFVRGHQPKMPNAVKDLRKF